MIFAQKPLSYSVLSGRNEEDVGGLEIMGVVDSGYWIGASIKLRS